MDWRHLFELFSAGRALYDGLLNLCVWNKDNGGMGSFYRSRHELVAAFKVGSVPHINNVELGRHGRNRTNVWDYAGVNTFKAGRLDELATHPTVNVRTMAVRCMSAFASIMSALPPKADIRRCKATVR